MQLLYGENSSWRPAFYADVFTHFSKRLNGIRLNAHVPAARSQNDIGRRAVLQMHDITPLGGQQSHADVQSDRKLNSISGDGASGRHHFMASSLSPSSFSSDAAASCIAPLWHLVTWMLDIVSQVNYLLVVDETYRQCCRGYSNFFTARVLDTFRFHFRSLASCINYAWTLQYSCKATSW